MNLSFGRESQHELFYDSGLILSFAARKRFEALRGRDRTVEGLSEIDLDKTMRMVDKLWENRPERDRQTKAAKPYDLSVDRDYNDKHGHRIAFPVVVRIDSGLPALVPVLKWLKSVDEVASSPRRLFTIIDTQTPWGPLQVIQPQVSSSRLQELVSSGRITPADLQFLERFGGACGCLEQDEMVALGRHESALATRDSLSWELWRCSEAIVEAIPLLRRSFESDFSDATDVATRVWQCWSFALECRRKAGLNLSDAFTSDKECYARGRTALLQEIADDEPLTRLFAAVQPPMADIWNTPLVSCVGFAAFCCWCVSTVLCGLTFKLEPFRKTPIARRLKSIDEALLSRTAGWFGRCVTVAAEERPESFSLNWLTTVTESRMSQANAIAESLSRPEGLDIQTLKVLEDGWTALFAEHVQSHTTGSFPLET